MKPGASNAAIAQRLRQARRTAGLTQESAAEKLGFARTTVVAIEKGERQVRPDELIAFANLYAIEVSDLVRPGVNLTHIELQFRGRIDAAGEAQLESVCRSLAEDYLNLEALCDAPLTLALPPEASLGTDPARSARLAAEDERRRLGLGLEPVSNMRSLMEERLGVRVFHFDLPTASTVSAVYFFEASAGPVICINSRQSWRRRRLSAAHELGHVIGSRRTPHVLSVEDDRGGRRNNPAELFSDVFQRHFLMPSGALERFVVARRQEKNGEFRPSDVVELADLYGVSFEAMIRALEEDGLVKAGSTAYLFAKRFEPNYDANAEGRFAADADTGLVSTRFRRLAVRAFRQRRLSEGTLAKLLRVERLEARRIVQSLAEDDEPAGTGAVSAQESEAEL